MIKQCLLQEKFKLVIPLSTALALPVVRIKHFSNRVKSCGGHERARINPPSVVLAYTRSPFLRKNHELLYKRGFPTLLSICEKNIQVFYERGGKEKEKRKEEAQTPDVVLEPDRLVGIGDKCDACAKGAVIRSVK